jgi:hypothetical protein
MIANELKKVHNQGFLLNGVLVGEMARVKGMFILVLKANIVIFSAVVLKQLFKTISAGTLFKIIISLIKTQ